jgi:CO/xanthine dehydrogenase FAD-binding subunit
MIADIPYERAKNLEHALTLLAKKGPTPTLLAGGTDVMVWLESGRFRPERVVDISRLRDDGCAGVTIAEAGTEPGAASAEVRIGALTTYRELIGSDVVAQRLPLLHAAAREVGAVQIQTRGTIGGNLGGSSPAGDTLPVLLAYGASVVVQSKKGGERVIPYAEFCTGYRMTALRPAELIVAVRVPVPPEGAVQRWFKAGTRLAQAISKVMVAGWGAVGPDGAVTHLRVAAGSVAPVPLLLDGVAAACVGRPLDDATIAEARAAAEAQVVPIDDVRSTAEYRRTVTGNMVASLLRDLRGSR